jgi:hypothetical protein
MFRSFADVALKQADVVEDDVWTREEVRTVLVGVSRFGYATRVFEEEAHDVDPRVRVIELGIRAWREQKPSLERGVVLLAVCDGLATAKPADPWAGIRPVNGPTEAFRTTVAARTALPWIFSKSDSGTLPHPFDVEDVMRAWRFGFLTRCAEMSLPDG